VLSHTLNAVDDFPSQSDSIGMPENLATLAHSRFLNRQPTSYPVPTTAIHPAFSGWPAPDHSGPSGSRQPHDVVDSDMDSQHRFSAADKGKRPASSYIPMSEGEITSDEGEMPGEGVLPGPHTATQVIYFAG